MTIAERLWMEGWIEGYLQGYLQGWLEGRLISIRIHILRELEVRFGAIPQEISTKLEEITEIERLSQLHRQSLICASVNDFYAQLLTSER